MQKSQRPKVEESGVEERERERERERGREVSNLAMPCSIKKSVDPIDI